MKYEDFERMQIYKCFLPFLYILSWILMFVGPTYIPAFYQKYYLFCVLYLTFRTVFSCIWTHVGSSKAHQLLDKLEKWRQMQPKTQLSSTQKHRQDNQKILVQHIFVIPNYNQEIELLCMTIQKICSHYEAKNRFSVFLAMEDHQKNATNKAQKLINLYKDKLKHIGFTIHSLRKYQQRGKAANVSWCVEHLEELYLNPKKINQNQVMLTIIDADSLVSQQYIKELENYIQESKLPLHSLIFQPCQMFTRNHQQVPFIVRYYDVAHGLVHFSNLFSVFGISFPLSNYSLSYSLAKKIGFWDTCPDAIGQDFHTTIKAFWKMRGNVTTVPIFTPFNQLSIHTGGGFWKDVCKRFWQAERHGRGCADAAYNIKNIIQNKVNWRTLFIAFQSLQITIFPAFLPWCLTSVSLFKLYCNYFNLQKSMNSYDVSFLFNICTLASIWMFIQYDSVCTRAHQVYQNKTKQQKLLRIVLEWFSRLLSYHFVFFICIFTITIPSVTIAVFRIVLGQSVYQTAQKKLEHKTNYASIEI